MMRNPAAGELDEMYAGGRRTGLKLSLIEYVGLFQQETIRSDACKALLIEQREQLLARTGR